MPCISAAARTGRFVLSACLLAASFAAPAQETVKIGNQVKQAAGTVVSMESGDVACYVTLKNDKGATFKEMADFSICEQERALKGKRVALTYQTAKVMADSCQGNPDCKQSKTVVLISAAKPTGGAAQPVAAKPAGGGQKSFCTPMEDVVFACRTGAKLVSVCAAKNASPKSGYVQYRFGKPDSSEPMEMVLPPEQPLPSRAATGDTLSFSGGGGAWIRFRKGDTAYVPYTGIGRWGPKGETREKAGVVVERGGKQIANVKCVGEAQSLLGPDWFGKTGIKAGKGEDFDMPD